MSIYKNGQKVLGNFNDVTGFVEKSDITTTIDSTSTNTQVPSAKSVYDNAIKDNNIKTYTSLQQLGIMPGSETLQDIAKAMVDGSIAIIPITGDVNQSLYPLKYGNLVAYRGNFNRVEFMFYPTTDISNLKGLVFVCNYQEDKDWLFGWHKICTTSVADVPLTDITSKLTNCSAGTIGYSVKDGICRVKINGLKPNTQTVEILATGILPNPDPIHNGHFSVMYTTGNMALFIIYNSSTDGVRLHSCNSTIAGDIYCTLEYPVKQS